MKYIVLALAVVLTGCSGGKSNKTTLIGKNALTFNGLSIGTPLDTLIKQLGVKPSAQSEDRLDYYNVTAEGVHWNTITYDFVGGQLARVTATQSNRDATSYKKLVRSFTEQYGKPAQNVDSLTIWARRDAELALQPGNILFARR